MMKYFLQYSCRFVFKTDFLQNHETTSGDLKVR